jgi:hypothetical protein
MPLDAPVMTTVRGMVPSHESGAAEPDRRPRRIR